MPSSSPICSVSVDLDPLRCYTSIHGLSLDADPDDADPIYTHALPRLLDLFAEHGVRATFFVIGADLSHEAHREGLRRALAEGHELASHTERHPYNLPALTPEALHAEISEVHERLRELQGEAPVGFRAPGYNIDARTLRLLEQLGYRYDSSVFPCPPYYAAKAAVMGLLWLQRRPSGSALIDVRTQWAPLRPYFPDQDAVYRRGRGARRSSLVELPMCVLPGARLPLIGTSLILAGPRLSAAAVHAAARYHHDFLNLELHGIDATDADADPVDDTLRAHQPDLKRSIERKISSLSAAFTAASQYYDFGTCAEAAERMRVKLTR